MAALAPFAFACAYALFAAALANGTSLLQKQKNVSRFPLEHGGYGASPARLGTNGKPEGQGQGQGGREQAVANKHGRRAAEAPVTSSEGGGETEGFSFVKILLGPLVSPFKRRFMSGCLGLILGFTWGRIFVLDGFAFSSALFSSSLLFAVSVGFCTWSASCLLGGAGKPIGAFEISMIVLVLSGMLMMVLMMVGLQYEGKIVLFGAILGVVCVLLHGVLTGKTLQETDEKED